jgi:hypothetical protein
MDWKYFDKIFKNNSKENEKPNTIQSTCNRDNTCNTSKLLNTCITGINEYNFIKSEKTSIIGSKLNSFRKFTSTNGKKGIFDKQIANHKNINKTNPSINLSNYLTSEPETYSPANKMKINIFRSNTPLNLKSQIDKYYNSLKKSTKSFRGDKSIQTTNFSRISSINLEDLIILEEKLSEIIENFKNSNICILNIFEWWKFYNYSASSRNFEKYFEDKFHKETANEFSHLEILTFLISFETSFEINLYNSTCKLVKSLLSLIHQNFLIFCDYLLKIVNSKSFTNIWLNKLQNIVMSKLNKRIKKGESLLLLQQNIQNIKDLMKNILKLSSNMTVFSAIIKNLSKYSIDKLINIVNKIIQKYQKENKNIIPEDIIIEEGENLPTIPIPYLKSFINDNKKYTLVFDLDETLIFFDNINCRIKYRQGLYELLDEVEKYYELVVFTAASQEVSNV